MDNHDQNDEEQGAQSLPVLYVEPARSDDSYDMLSDVLEPLSATSSNDGSNISTGDSGLSMLSILSWMTKMSADQKAGSDVVSTHDGTADMLMQQGGAEVTPYVPPPPGFLRDEQTGELHDLSLMWIRGVDLYGFRVQLVSSDDAKTLAEVSESAKSREQLWKSVEEQRGYGWFKINEGNKWGTPIVQELARKGIPPALRRVVWLEESRARLKKKQHTYFYYNNLVLSSRNPEVVRALESDINAIDADIERSFHNHKWLSSSEGRESLRAVLVAYAMHNPSVGYSQGMINVAGMLLLAMHFHAKDAFWMLVTLVEDILYPGFYGRDQHGLKVEMGACFELLKDYNGPVAAHVEWLARMKQMVPQYIVAEWFVSLFACSDVPSETAMRIWDILFTSRRPVILFGVALAIFREADYHILQLTDYDDLKRLLKQMVSTRLLNPDYLLDLVDEELAKFHDFDEHLDFSRQQTLSILKGRSPPLRR